MGEASKSSRQPSRLNSYALKLKALTQTLAEKAYCIAVEENVCSLYVILLAKERGMG